MHTKYKIKRNTRTLANKLRPTNKFSDAICVWMGERVIEIDRPNE